LDRCLSCRSCENSCPYDVKYGRLLDIGRELVEQEIPRPFKQKVMRKFVDTVVAHRGRFNLALRLGQALRFALPSQLRQRIPGKQRDGSWSSAPHKRIMLAWEGCVQPSLSPNINAAASRILDRFGISLVKVKAECCGSLHQHMAESEAARKMMRNNIDALWPHIEAGAEAIVFTASGCGMHFKDYGELLKDDPDYRDKAARISQMTKDLAETIDAECQHSDVIELIKPDRVRRIALQASCSLQHGAKVNGVVECLLKKAGFKLVPVRYKFLCCGSAGAYSVLQRDMSVQLRETKLKTLMAGRPEMIATTNIGCLYHLAEQAPVPVMHWAEMLDDALSGFATMTSDSDLESEPQTQPVFNRAIESPTRGQPDVSAPHA
jgi:glycolate oxidase iron-sulfur subunit